jgi:hypothetical protein
MKYYIQRPAFYDGDSGSLTILSKPIQLTIYSIFSILCFDRALFGIWGPFV